MPKKRGEQKFSAFFGIPRGFDPPHAKNLIIGKWLCNIYCIYYELRQDIQKIIKEIVGEWMQEFMW